MNNRDFRRDFREPRVNMNERIRYPEIRVVADDGAQLGVLPTREALAIARSKGLDLIEVAPNAQPPVCKIMDYGKFKYETSKKEREAAKKHKQADLKGIKMFPHIDEHDFDVKVRSALKFLQDGDKVKVTVAFKGREITHPEFGRMQMDKIIESANSIGAIVEKPPAMEGRQMTMILSPKSGSGAKPKPSVPAAPKPPQAKPAEATAPIVNVPPVAVQSVAPTVPLDPPPAAPA